MFSKKTYRDLLANHFKNLKIEPGLFYKSDYSLRFELGVGDTNCNSYFDNVCKRSLTIIESVFFSKDIIYVIIIDRKHKKRKIRFSNFMFKQIESFNKSEVKFSKITSYSLKEKKTIQNIAMVQTTMERLNWQNIIRAIAYSDFPQRKPRLDNQPISSKQVYFINADRKVIINMYDDRGMDILATQKETLLPVYNKYNDWLLKYDKTKMDKIFKS